MNELGQQLAIKLQVYEGKMIHVELNGGRVLRGILKGYDHLNNMILDMGEEYVRTDANDLYKVSENRKREIGLCIVKASCLISICSDSERQAIDNPFISE